MSLKGRIQRSARKMGVLLQLVKRSWPSWPLNKVTPVLIRECSCGATLENGGVIALCQRCWANFELPGEPIMPRPCREGASAHSCQPSVREPGLRIGTEERR